MNIQVNEDKEKMEKDPLANQRPEKCFAGFYPEQD